MTRFYLDTSVAVHALQGTPAAEAWFDAATRQPEVELVSSRLLQTELTRVLRRDGRPVVEREDILGHVATVDLTEAILNAAEAITVHVKTLDSIHLASALAVGGHVVMATHDNNVKEVAAVLGLETFDPLESQRPRAAHDGGQV